MAEEGSNNTSIKQIWIRPRRSLGAVGFSQDGPVKEVYVEEGAASQDVRALLVSQFRVPDEAVMKLRNSSGALIPIKSSIAGNDKAMPYTLEIVNAHLNVKPRPRSVKLKTYGDVNDQTGDALNARFDRLEQTVQTMKNMRRGKIVAELSSLKSQLDFLEQRLEEVEPLNWQGMFKRNPMW